MAKRTRSFLANLACGAVIFLLVFSLSYSRRDTFLMDDSSLEVVLHCLSDGLFVAAVMLLGTGILRVVRNQGVFDVMGYGMRSVVDMTFPMFRREEKEDLSSYCKRKAETRRPARGILLAGTVYLVLASVVLVLYYHAG